MARGLGFRDDGARKVELACFLSGIGTLMMTVYRNHYDTGDFVLSDDFIEQNHLYLTERIIQRFQLPEYLHEMIMTNCFILERMGIAPPTVVKLAIAAVEWSFQTLDNKLVLLGIARGEKQGQQRPFYGWIVNYDMATILMLEMERNFV